MKPVWIDTHCHLHLDAFTGDVAAVVSRAHAAGVAAMITLGTDLASSKACASLSSRFPGVYAAAGIHPSEVARARAEDEQALETLIRHHPRIVAVGEIGLDFYWDTTHWEAQYEWFGRMLRLASRLELPVVIHNRRAHREMTWFFQEQGIEQLRGVMHCFSGQVVEARFYLDMGLHISFTANVTYPDFRGREVVKFIPLDRLLLETDAPYMAPQPYRKQRNEPAYLPLLGEAIAGIHRIPVEEVARRTTENAMRLFGFPEFLGKVQAEGTF